jgi:hypothetical protein
MFGGYGNIVKSDYKKPFKIFFESPLFYDTVVEIVFAFDIERSIALDKPNNQDFQDSNGVFISDNTFTHLSLTYSTASRNSGFSLYFIYQKIIIQKLEFIHIKCLKTFVAYQLENQLEIGFFITYYQCF